MRSTKYLLIGGGLASSQAAKILSVKDPDAPIGEFADLFVVGDLFQIVPKLTEEIRRRKA